MPKTDLDNYKRVGVLVMHAIGSTKFVVVFFITYLQNSWLILGMCTVCMENRKPFTCDI